MCGPHNVAPTLCRYTPGMVVTTPAGVTTTGRPVRDLETKALLAAVTS